MDSKDSPVNANRFWVIAAASVPQIFSFWVLSSQLTFSQIVPDNTLPRPSTVTVEDNTYTIDEGTEAGSNLFHSFQNFSVPTGTEAFFNNTVTVENILTRVTGGSASNIDGSIRANGTANLFLLNPLGLSFGLNARLNIGGSFLGTTANSIVFENGLEFSATAPEGQTLLTVSVPIGLQFNGQGENIQVRGEGHRLRSPEFSTIVREDNSGELDVKPGRTLALVGGNTLLDGAILTAESGRIELGGVEEGFVRSNVQGEHQWTFDYEGVSRFRDVRLVRQSSVDVSGTEIGSIQMVGRQIVLSDGSIALLQNQGTQTFGDLRVRASESVTLTGTTPDESFATNLLQATTGSGRAGNIEITTSQLTVREGAQVFNQTIGEGIGGNIDVRASENIEVIGLSPVAPLVRSIIATIGFESRSAGNIAISTRHLSVRSGGNLASTT